MQQSPASQGYTSRSSAVQGIESIKKNAPGAPIVDAES
ncbi:YegP family protein [Jongsikchunia kroppenstedtii]